MLFLMNRDEVTAGFEKKVSSFLNLPSAETRRTLQRKSNGWNESA